MKTSVAVILIGGLLAGAPVQAQEVFVGTWDIVVERPEEMGDGKLVWVVTETDDGYVIEPVFGEEDEAGVNLTEALGAPTSVEVEFDGKRFTMTSVFGIDGMADGGSIDLVVINSGEISGDSFEGISSMKLGEADAIENAMTGTRR